MLDFELVVYFRDFKGVWAFEILKFYLVLLYVAAHMIRQNFRH